MEREENPFEDQIIAQEWIRSIETEKGKSRDREIYPLIKEWSQEISHDVLVEIGSGQGICSSKLQIKNRYIGIEPSPYLVNRAMEQYAGTNIEFLVGNAYSIPLETNSADAVFSVGVWFHIEDLDRAHKEVARVLKPEKEFLIITANPDANYIWESWYEDKAKEGKKIVGKVLVPNGYLSKNIFYAHSENELTDSLTANNLNIKSIKKFGYGDGGYRDMGVWMAIRTINEK